MEEKYVLTLMNIKQLDPPVFDPNGSETISQFMRRIEDYGVELKKHKYEIIINFINLWLIPYKITLKSLLDFKNIDEEKITLDKKHNKRIIKKYSDIVAKQLGLSEDKKYEDDVDTDEIPEDEVIKFIRKILDTIEYSLFKKSIDGNIFYSILSKPKVTKRKKTY